MADVKTWSERMLENQALTVGDAMCDEIRELRAALQAQQGEALDAARFVFSYTEPEAMLRLEMKALGDEQSKNNIEWWRAAIDAAMLAARREG